MSAEKQYDATWVVSSVVERQAAALGDKPFFTAIGSRETISFRQAKTQSEQVASFLQKQGVAHGDRVACYMSSSLDYVRVWLGASRLGATLVPLNLDLTGKLLEYQLNTCRAKVVVVDAESRQNVEASAAGLAHVHLVIVCGGDAPQAESSTISFDPWKDCAPFSGPMPSPGDIGCIVYTSGTTGPSKGVLMPHAHCYIFGLGSVEHATLTSDDVVYLFLPLFHVNGLFMQAYASLIAGASVVLRPRFSASSFLSDAIEYGATISSLLGSIASYLSTQPPGPHDRQHQLRLVHQTPKLPALEQMWHERFGVPDVITGYGMTEVNLCVWSSPAGTPPGSCGRPYAKYFDIIVAGSETDVPLPAGQVGEILVRPKHPFGFMAGYDGMLEATVVAWRNLWFHTGDAGYFDEEGFIYYVDRMKDCIRRGGENISSYEVEQALIGYAGVAEIAAFPVPADAGGEYEVMVAVVPLPGATIDLKAMNTFACEVLPRFARPRYFELVEELPKTGTAKVRKVELRKRGVSASTFDARSLVKTKMEVSA